jgi:hypothetical protein
LTWNFGFACRCFFLPAEDEIAILAAKGDIDALKQLANTIRDPEKLKALLNERHRYTHFCCLEEIIKYQL